MANIEIYGASDDLIEVDGDIREEFNPKSDDFETDGDLLAFSDGTVLRVKYGAGGVWRITQVAKGSAAFSKVEAPEDDDSNYSDRVTLAGDIKWCVHGVAIEKAKG